MLQLLQNLNDGTTTLTDLPAPGSRPGAVLLRTTRTLVSAGTERMLVNFGKAGWLGKARQQPEKVRAVFNKVRTDGLMPTIRAVQAKLEQPIAIGYCQVGVVVGDTRKTKGVEPRPENSELGSSGEQASDPELSSFQPGDRVVSNGPHSEMVSVSARLCARIPDEVSDDAATFTPLAAIALEGIDLLGIKSGDKVVVTGLGLIGQLAARILKARGCEVMGTDPSSARRGLAAHHGVISSTGDPVVKAMAWSGGKGVTAVLITASTASNELVNQAARCCQYRGKVVLVGVVGLQLNRADFYANEISFQVSCSYGRRNHAGPGSVRANFDAVLSLMASRQLSVDDLITHQFSFEDAGTAYLTLNDPTSLGILMKYERGIGEDALLSRCIQFRTEHPTQRAGSGESLRLALIGAGNFASRTLLPALRHTGGAADLVTVASSQGAAAYLIGKGFGAAIATTDVDSVLGDKTLSAVLLTTRHDAHAQQALDALRAGKHVWVEKPLALSLEELDAMNKELDVGSESGSTAKPLLVVGFNRRFSPLAAAVRKLISSNRGPWTIKATINAGRLPYDHWTLDPVTGGGRIVGEGCHWVDLIRYFSGSPIESVTCTRRDTDGQDGGTFELRFRNGGVGIFDYRTDFAATVPKETIVVSGPAGEVTIHNWTRLSSNGLGRVRIDKLRHSSQTKGHPEALSAFFAAIRVGRPPIPYDEIFEVSRWAIVMQAMKEAENVSA